MIKNRVVPLGVLSGFVIIGGIIVAVLLAVLLNKLTDTIAVHHDETWKENAEYIAYIPLWILGFLYIIPGILGFVAAFVQKKCMYIVALVFGILFLIAMAILNLVLGILIPTLIFANSRYQLNCSLVDLNGQTCANVQELRDIFIAMCVMVVLTWMVLLVVFILCCYYTCCAKNMATPGVVVQSGPQTNISVNQVSQQQNSQLNPNSMNTVPAYGAPQYGPYVHGAPQYGQYVHGAPQYGQYVHGAPQYVQNGYIPSDGQNGYIASDGRYDYVPPDIPNGQIWFPVEQKGLL